MINTFIHGDNLEILRKIDDNSIDLIYLDPPFNSDRDYKGPKDKEGDEITFKDTWTYNDIKNEWETFLDVEYPNIYGFFNVIGLSEKDYSYLIYMTLRLIETHRVLKDTGSIYLHCDPSMSHYLKIVMDAIFGRDMFKNEIVWTYRTGGVSKKYFPRKHDIIFFYTKSKKYIYNPLKERIYYEKSFFNNEVDEQGKYYADVYVRGVWDNLKPIINVSKERTGYPTQKPLALLQRIIKASSNKGDLILEPFCGSGTACVAAHQLNRKWIGIDQNKQAIEIAQERMDNEPLLLEL